MTSPSDSIVGMRKAWRVLASLSLVLAATALYAAVYLAREQSELNEADRRQEALVTCQLVETKTTQIETLLLLGRLLDRVERPDIEDQTRRAFAETRKELRRERINLRLGIRQLLVDANGDCAHHR